VRRHTSRALRQRRPGINARFAVPSGVKGKAPIRVGWSFLFSHVAGVPTHSRPLEYEYKSDIFGERGIMLGAVQRHRERSYGRFSGQGMTTDYEFLKPRSRSRADQQGDLELGLKEVYEQRDDRRRQRSARRQRPRTIRSGSISRRSTTACMGNEVRSVIRQPAAHGTDRWARSTPPMCDHRRRGPRR